jgi:hypothetical protein
MLKHHKEKGDQKLYLEGIVSFVHTMEPGAMPDCINIQSFMKQTKKGNETTDKQ